MEKTSMTLVSYDLQGQLNGMLEKMEVLFNKVVEKSEPKWKWIQSEDARKMFGVSKKTWQTWRDKRHIPFSQFGMKVYYHLDDLNNFMIEHKI